MGYERFLKELTVLMPEPYDVLIVEASAEEIGERSLLRLIE